MNFRSGYKLVLNKISNYNLKHCKKTSCTPTTFSEKKSHWKSLDELLIRCFCWYFHEMFWQNWSFGISSENFFEILWSIWFFSLFSKMFVRICSKSHDCQQFFKIYRLLNVVVKKIRKPDWDRRFIVGIWNYVCHLDI